MTNDELKTAAERWGRKGIRSATYPEEETMYEIPRQRLLDAEHLADAYLARLAADEQREREDAEPITREYLSSIGFHEPTLSDVAFILPLDGSVSWPDYRTFVRIRESGDAWYPSIACPDDRHEVYFPHLIDTRGQLRKLLEALKGDDT